MAQLPLLFVFALLAALDVAALLVGIQRIGSASLPPLPTAAVIHLTVVAIAMAAVRLNPKTKDRAGVASLSLLVGVICLLTPVLGSLVAAWLVAGGFRSAKSPGLRDLIQLGNPLDEAVLLTHPETFPLDRPLSSFLRDHHVPAQRMASPLLRQCVDRRSLKILRALRHQPDARTQLYAQGALSAMFENRERELENLRKAVSATHVSGKLADHERLASALRETALAGLRSAGESRALTDEAREHYDRALAISPTDPACLLGKALCLLDLNQLDSIPDLYGRLCAQPGAESQADRLELAYFAALGNWQRVYESCQRREREGRSHGIAPGLRRFWLSRTTAA